jgi:hypothetical protein
MAQLKNSGRTATDALPQRGPSATKRGPGRKHRGGKPGNRMTKPRAVRAYQALLAAWASKVITKAPLRDDHGAYTLVGKARDLLVLIGDEYVEEHRPRRVWLAGISAQRGF